MSPAEIYPCVCVWCVSLIYDCRWGSYWGSVKRRSVFVHLVLRRVMNMSISQALVQVGGVRFQFWRRASSILLSLGKNHLNLAFFEGEESSTTALWLCLSCINIRARWMKSRRNSLIAFISMSFAAEVNTKQNNTLVVQTRHMIPHFV